MGSSFAPLVLLGLAFVLANLPFVTARFCMVWRPSAGKHLGWNLLEVLIYYLIMLGIGMALERQRGQISPQAWEFYAITLAVFLTLAFPGFVRRYLWKTKA